MATHLTPDELLARLLATHGAAAVEDLRGKTKRSVRTLQRWKSNGWPQSAATVLEMLTEAGLLRVDGDGDEATPDNPLGAVVASVRNLATLSGQFEERLQEVEKKLDQAIAASGPKARSTRRRTARPA